MRAGRSLLYVGSSTMGTYSFTVGVKYRWLPVAVVSPSVLTFPTFVECVIVCSTTPTASLSFGAAPSATPVAPQQWFLQTTVAETCDITCGAQGLSCSSSYWPTTNTEMDAIAATMGFRCQSITQGWYTRPHFNNLTGTAVCLFGTATMSCSSMSVNSW